MQHAFELLGGHVFSQHGRQMVRTARSGLQGGTSLLVELVDGMANGLFVAAERLRDAGNRLPASGCQQDLAATKHKGIRRTQPGAQRLLFLLGKVSDKNAWSHRSQYTTFRITSLENALGKSDSRLCGEMEFDFFLPVPTFSGACRALGKWRELVASSQAKTLAKQKNSVTRILLYV
jgi:hypothetical protein